ncbi:S-acyl fatty acid synthase thioesterase, medium chain-like [Mantella aurantiaca]
MDKLINCLYSRPNANTRLVCFPWAGGGSLYNAQWGRLFDDSVEDNGNRLRCPVYSQRGLARVRRPEAGTDSIHRCDAQRKETKRHNSVILKQMDSAGLPGRESRSQEPLPHNLDQLLDEITDVLLPLLREKPFAFFGHSFGSFNSYSTAARLKEKYGLQPIHLFVSGSPAPHTPYRSSSQKKSELSDEDFMKWMAVKQGTPPELLQNKEAMKLFLPLMKADFKLIENYVFKKPSVPVLSCGMTCFYGTEDVPRDLSIWKDLTSGDFSIHMLPGGHFYLRDSTNEKSLVQYISRYIEAAEINYC